MPQLVLFAIDICAVVLLVFGLYFPRHRRRDLVVAYLGVNVGVLAVASALSASNVGAGLGLGLALFGVLSIIRLRSTELDQHEVAYYFSALALGILGALSTTSVWLSGGLMGLILVVMFLGDHPRLLRHYRHQIIVLDSAVTDQVTLVAQLEQLLGARVHTATVQRLDLVNETTLVDVRYSVRGRGGAPVAAGRPAQAGAGR
ncbi:DUF4956 domain-containing protein [Micromonospora fiedleri]|uniref:DUF4956 domain-containing protein n=1 Tax=Micromonospora fiedleri TaxID=1157498 RepID=A0ABS1UMJ8_9ACTN|nr:MULTISPECIES: DUF4956 domain-containing protein [Micromonospora]MBL6276591.1 DUF4956 domain-containing protein [Micromonospora fiedleri]WSG10005.1 DUF4956 domain-containing protein [Micromonospora sp. NBC_01739]WSK40238.1 DUF4956 domain-containing protein [Micromonospora maris]